MFDFDCFELRQNGFELGPHIFIFDEVDPLLNYFFINGHIFRDKQFKAGFDFFHQIIVFSIWEILILVYKSKNFVQQTRNIIGKHGIGGFAEYANNQAENWVEVGV